MYSFSRNRKIRGQHVTLEIRIPLGKSITLPESQKEMIYEIKATHSVDSDYFENQTRWVSSEEGMMCTNCNIY